MTHHSLADLLPVDADPCSIFILTDGKMGGWTAVVYDFENEEWHGINIHDYQIHDVLALHGEVVDSDYIETFIGDRQP